MIAPVIRAVRGWQRFESRFRPRTSAGAGVFGVDIPSQPEPSPRAHHSVQECHEELHGNPKQEGSPGIRRVETRTAWHPQPTAHPGMLGGNGQEQHGIPGSLTHRWHRGAGAWLAATSWTLRLNWHQVPAALTTCGVAAERGGVEVAPHAPVRGPSRRDASLATPVSN